MSTTSTPTGQSPSLLPPEKKAKTSREEDDGDNHDDVANNAGEQDVNRKPSAVDPPLTNRTSTSNIGITSKLRDLQKAIDEMGQHVNKKKHQVEEARRKLQEKESKNKSVEKEKSGTTNEEDLREVIRLQGELLELNERLSGLNEGLSGLKERLSGLKERLSGLKNKFLAGQYFASMADYWKKDAVHVEGNAVWSDVQFEQFRRTSNSADSISARGNVSAEGVSVTTPYKDTRLGAEDTKKSAASSGTTRTSALSQKQKEIRDKVWPTDVFGNKANQQEIAHLLPAGRYQHKEWVQVASAVVGLRNVSISAGLSQMKKSTRGFYPNTQSEEQNEKRSGEGNKKSGLSRVPGTGVVHFVPNKLRFKNQKHVWDGSNCSALMIPIMDLHDAVNWKGRTYRAIFMMGHPGDSEASSGDDDDLEAVPQPVALEDLCVDVGLSTSKVMWGDTVKDATREEIERARKTLSQAVLALRDSVGRLTVDEIEMLGLPNRGEALKQANTYAQAPDCILPGKIAPQPGQQRRPVCIVVFGDNTDAKMHPAPDPLLLSYKAAVVWAKMTGKRLLANGAHPDPYPEMTEGDFIAEQAYYDAKFSHNAPETWQELAVRLGQPNGYTDTG